MIAAFLAMALGAAGAVVWQPAGAIEPVEIDAPGSVASDGPTQVVTDHFQIEGGAHMPLGLCADAAELTLVLASDLMGLEGERIATDRLPIYLCDSKAEITSVEHGLGAWNPSRNNPWGHGFFYYRGPAVTLLYNPRRTPGGVPHEVTHWIVSHFTRRCPRIINEGLASYIDAEVLLTMPEQKPLGQAAIARRFALLSRFKSAHPDLQLASLFHLRGKQFEDSRLYAAGWALAHTLFRYEKRRRGTLRELLKDYGSRGKRRDPWEVFAKRYPVQWVENEWREFIATVTR